MKYIRLQLCFVLLVVSSALAQAKVDTLYYDSKWKGCEQPFASYYRVYSVASDSTSVKRYRDFFITGEVQGEGEFLSLDKFDDANSVFDGEYTTFFKTGKVEQKGCKCNGLDDGEYTKYDENGLILQHATFSKGELDGIYTEFREDNLCYQLEYANGRPLHSFYTLSNKDGFCSKVDLITNKPIYESPLVQNLKYEFKDGDRWSYYNENGLMIGMTIKKVNDYGKYFQISIVVANNSLYPIELDPANMVASLMNKKNEQRVMRVYQAEEYLKKVKRRQAWTVALLGVAEGVSAGVAGYSSSTSTTFYNDYSGYGNSGIAFSTTSTYDAAAAYQAQVIADQRIASYSNVLLSDREVKEQGYLKKSVVYPGDMVAGFINIERVKGGSLEVLLNIAGATYAFPWDISEF